MKGLARPPPPPRSARGPPPPPRAPIAPRGVTPRPMPRAPRGALRAPPRGPPARPLQQPPPARGRARPPPPPPPAAPKGVTVPRGTPAPPGRVGRGPPPPPPPMTAARGNVPRGRSAAPVLRAPPRGAAAKPVSGPAAKRVANPGPPASAPPVAAPPRGPRKQPAPPSAAPAAPQPPRPPVAVPTPGPPPTAGPAPAPPKPAAPVQVTAVPDKARKVVASAGRPYVPPRAVPAQQPESPPAAATQELAATLQSPGDSEAERASHAGNGGNQDDSDSVGSDSQSASDSDGSAAPGSQPRGAQEQPAAAAGTPAPGPFRRTQDSLVKRVQERVAAAIEDATASLTEQQQRQRELDNSRAAAAAALRSLEQMNERMAQRAAAVGQLSSAIRANDFETAWRVHRECLGQGDQNGVSEVLLRARERANARASVKSVDLSAAARAGIAEANPQKVQDTREAIERSRVGPARSGVTSAEQQHVSHMNFMASINVLSPRDYHPSPARQAAGGGSPALQAPHTPAVLHAGGVAMSSSESARKVAHDTRLVRQEEATGLVHALRYLPGADGSGPPSTHRTLARSLVRRSEKRQQAANGSSPTRRGTIAEARRNGLLRRANHVADPSLRVRTAPLRKKGAAATPHLPKDGAGSRAARGASSGRKQRRMSSHMMVQGWSDMPEFLVNPPPQPHLPPPVHVAPVPTLEPAPSPTATRTPASAPRSGRRATARRSPPRRRTHNGDANPRTPTTRPADGAAASSLAQSTPLLVLAGPRRDWLKKSIVRSAKRPPPPRKDGSMKYT